MPSPAEKAGWNPEDGDPPFEHTEFVEPLASADSLDALPQEDAE